MTRAISAALLLIGGVARSAPAQASEMKTVSVIDPFLHQVAYTMQIPADWHFDATLLHAALRPTLVFRASSADGLSGLQLLPPYEWVSTKDSTVRRRFEAEKTTIMPYIRADDFVTEHLLPEARPGATVIGREPMPDSIKLMESDLIANRRYEIEMDTRNPRQKSDGARFRIAYDIDGHPVEESIVAIKVSTTERRAGYLERTIVTVSAGRAPRGQLDNLMGRIVAISRSVAPDSAWLAHRSEIARKQAVQKEIAAAAEPEMKWKSMVDTSAAERRENWVRPHPVTP